MRPLPIYNRSDPNDQIGILYIHKEKFYIDFMRPVIKECIPDSGFIPIDYERDENNGVKYKRVRILSLKINTLQ